MLHLITRLITAILTTPKWTINNSGFISPIPTVQRERAVKKPWASRTQKLNELLTTAAEILGDLFTYSRAIAYVRAVTGKGCSKRAVSRWKQQNL
jgi:hypothetical protein